VLTIILHAHAHRRLIIVSNVLPVRGKRDEQERWVWEWDEDALVAQAKVWAVLVLCWCCAVLCGCSRRGLCVEPVCAAGGHVRTALHAAAQHVC
jgi:hypothetical protein